MTDLADAFVAAAWREVLPDPADREKRRRIRALRSMLENNGSRISPDGRAAITHQVAALLHAMRRCWLCDARAVALFWKPRGCECWPDRLQWLCWQHAAMTEPLAYA